MSVFIKTNDILSDLSTYNDSILVSFSGGKDSLVVLDLAVRYFKTVKCFFMYLVDDLEINKNVINATDKYKVELIKIPHWGYYQCKKKGIFCRKIDSTPDIKIKDIHRYITELSGINNILTGWKKTDSIWRRQYVSQLGEDFKNTISPIYDWNKYEVLAYLKSKNIEIPDGNGIVSSGVDFTTSSIMHIYKNYPGDISKIENEFPFARAIIKKQEYYNNVEI